MMESGVTVFRPARPSAYRGYPFVLFHKDGLFSWRADFPGSIIAFLKLRLSAVESVYFAVSIENQCIGFFPCDAALLTTSGCAVPKGRIASRFIVEPSIHPALVIRLSAEA